MDIRRRCTCGERDGRWRRRGRCSSHNSSTTPRTCGGASTRASSQAPKRRATGLARGCLLQRIEDLAKWENTADEEVLGKTREEIRKRWREVCGLNADHPQAAELFHPDKIAACITRSPVAVRSLWKPNVSGWRPMPATSIPSPCGSTRP